MLSHKRFREATRTGGLAPTGGTGGVVEISETIYGRCLNPSQGRGSIRFELSNSAHKNAILSLVERGGQVRS